MDYWLALVNLLASTWMVAIIAFVQFIHYPTFDFVEEIRFRSFHAHHARRTTMLVLSAMALELISASGLVYFRLDSLTLSVLLLALLAWGLTFFVSVPLHNQLAQGKNSKVIAKLVTTNTWRTTVWAIKFVLVLIFFLKRWALGVI